MAARPSFVAVLLVLLPLQVGCRAKPSATGDGVAPAASATAAPKDLVMIPDEQIQEALNPSHEKPYSGPIGSVHGVVRVTGDTSPELPEVLAKIRPGKCDDARAFYGKLFREGPNRELGDVLVAVTDYKGFVPPKSKGRTVLARGCAFDSRTIALTFGELLAVANKSQDAFIPRLLGASQPALLVAVPGGEPVKIYPQQVGQYSLEDQTHIFAKADVFVLKYPTTAVTGIDGAFDIGDVPAGDVTVTAYLPATKQQVSQRVKVVAGEATTVGLTIPFEMPKSPSPSASVT